MEHPKTLEYTNMGTLNIKNIYLLKKNIDIFGGPSSGKARKQDFISDLLIFTFSSLHCNHLAIPFSILALFLINMIW